MDKVELRIQVDYSLPLTWPENAIMAFHGVPQRSYGFPLPQQVNFNEMGGAYQY
jgi:hypothetical protein